MSEQAKAASTQAEDAWFAAQLRTVQARTALRIAEDDLRRAREAENRAYAVVCEERIRADIAARLARGEAI